MQKVELWQQSSAVKELIGHGYLTIIPRVRIGSESIAHEADCFSKIQLVGQIYRE